MSLSREDKVRTFSLFKQFQTDPPTSTSTSTSPGLNRKLNDKILIVDGLNTFIRCWAANPMMNEDGLHTGGVAGFLKSVGYAIKLINPTRCVIVFDGDGGSQKRRKIFPEYKMHRKSTVRLNRSYEELSDQDSEEANKLKQLVRVSEYLQHLPVNILISDQIEADDSIAYCAVEYFKDSQVTIMSSDKDFIQLVSDRVKVWSPSKKTMYGPVEVLRDYGIHPNNFTLFRIMDGDDSDNIDGIRGVGIKTAAKHFPFISEPEVRDVKFLIEYATQNRGKYKVYDKVVEGASILERNYQLMQLKESIASTISQLHINDILTRVKIPRLDRFGLIKLINEDKMWNNIPNHQVWINETFLGLDSMAKSVL
jgi:5'-3' exonuclease